MGLSSKKQKQTAVENTTSTATTTPQVPDWLLDPAKKLAGSFSGLVDGGSTPYTPEVSGLQRQAFAGAGNLSTSPLIGEGANMVRNTAPVQGESLLSGLDSYFNPYKDKVLDPVLADYDEQSGITRAAQAADGAKGAFRGSRFGVREGQTEGELARGRAATEGGLLSDMYSQATELSGQDAARRQSAAESNAGRSLQGAGLLGTLGQAQGSEDRATLGAQGTLGATQTDLQNQIKQYPLEFQKALSGLFAGLDPSLFSGQTVNGTSSGTTNTTTSGGGGLGGLLGGILGNVGLNLDMGK